MRFGKISGFAAKHGVDNRANICYSAHMNTMLLGSLYALATFFDALSDVTRLKILSALTVSSMCVTDLSTLTALNQTTVSHQLRILRTARIVDCKRQGKVMFYSLSERYPQDYERGCRSGHGRERVLIKSICQSEEIRL